MRRVYVYLVSTACILFVLMPTLGDRGLAFQHESGRFTGSFEFLDINPGPDRIEASGCQLVYLEGYPLTPVKTVYVAVPDGCSEPLLEYVCSGVSELSVPEIMKFKGRIETYNPEQSVNIGSFFPEHPAEITEEGFFRNQRYIKVSLYPVQFHGDISKVRLNKNISISIDFSLDSADISNNRSQQDRYFEKLYEKTFANYSQSANFRSNPRVEIIDLEVQKEPYLNSSSDVYKMSVSADGIYRLSYSYLSAANPQFASADPSMIHISNMGSEIAISFTGDGDAVFESGEYFEFYGKAFIGEDVAGEFQRGDYTDENIYYIWSDETQGLRCTQFSAEPLSGYSVPASFRDTVRYEGFSPSSVFMFVDTAGDDCFLWKRPYHFANQNSPTDIANATADHAGILTPSVDPLGGDAAIDLCLRGSSKRSQDPDHHSIIRVNGIQISEEYWNDRQTFHHIESFPASYLQPDNTVTLYVEDPASMGVTSDYIYSNWIEITYDRLFESLNDVLPFSMDSGLYNFQVSGFSGNNISVWDITDKTQPRIASNTVISPGSVSFEGDSSGELEYYVYEENAVLEPDSIFIDTPSTLKSDISQTDYIIISHGDFISSPAVTDLLNLRQSQGMTTRLVNIEDVFDEFSNGIYSINAIKDFLSYAFFNWEAPAPSFVLLIGDGTFDHKNFLAQPDDGYDFVPAKIINIPADAYVGYYSSDLWFTLLAGEDFLPEMHIGRIPGRTISEINAAINKVLTYEQTPDSGSWRSNALIMADYDSVCGDTTFEAVSDALISQLNLPNTVDKLYYSDPPWNCSTIDSDSDSVNDIVEFLNAGASIVSWAGHGAWQYWGNDILFETITVDQLSVQAKYPFVINATCYSAGFHHALATPVLGEKFLCTSSKGAVAFLGPSTYTYPFLAYQQAESVFKGIFGRDKLRITGDAVFEARKALDAGGDVIGALCYILLGDPATNLILPAPAAASNLTVDSVGNGTVDLSWTASPDSVSGYNIYRSTQYDSGFVKVNGSLIPVVSYQDSGLTNTMTYYFYVVSVDSGGFESAASNIVSAVPLNPDPPAPPTSLSLTDLTTGKRISASWNSNAESDISYYTLHYGTETGIYDFNINTGKTTSWTVTNLIDGLTYYFAVTATNTSSKTSGFSNELSSSSSHSTGFNPPELLQNVTVRKNGNNLVLDWQIPSGTIYGDSVSLGKYGIYRSTDPSWIPDRRTLLSVDRIGEVVDDGSPSYSFTDPAGLTGDPDNYFYCISSYDIAGNESSIARYIPDIAYNLKVTLGRGGIVGLSWNPVSNDFYGNPITVSYYNIYRSNISGFTPDRKDHTNLLTPTNEAQTAGCLYSYTSDGGTYYYKVLAVDSKGNEGPE